MEDHTLGLEKPGRANEMKVEALEKEGHILDQDVETCEKLLFLFVQQAEAQFKVEEIYSLD